MIAARRLNIIYVGTLPPHPGGSAIVGAQLVNGLAARGHRICALAPMTEDALAQGDQFATSQPMLAVHRFIVPYFESAPNTPAAAGYRTAEGEQVRAHLARLIAAERPAVVIIGRETFAWHVPDLTCAARIPTLLLIHGGTTAGMLMGSIARADADSLLAQFRRVNALAAVAAHTAETYRRLGFPDIHVVQNGVDLEQFAPRPKSKALLQRWDVRPEQVIVMHGSNLKDLKCPLDLVRSAAAAVKQNERLVYLFVGDGPMRGATENACRAAGLRRTAASSVGSHMLTCRTTSTSPTSS